MYKDIKDFKVLPCKSYIDIKIQMNENKQELIG